MRERRCRCTSRCPRSRRVWSKPNFPAGGRLPVYRCADRWICFLSSKPGKFWDNRGGWTATPKMRPTTHPWLFDTPPKKYFFARGGLVFTIIFTFILPLFLPLFLPSKKKSSPAAGLGACGASAHRLYPYLTFILALFFTLIFTFKKKFYLIFYIIFTNY